jgi:hypothetical protein
MSTDHTFNLKLADAQLTALEALQAIIKEAASPPTADSARAKTMAQFVNIRLRSALALLRLKPRKTRPETATKPRETAPDLTLAAIEAALAFAGSQPLLAPLPGPTTPQVRTLLERAGTPQHVPRPEKAA